MGHIPLIIQGVLWAAAVYAGIAIACIAVSRGMRFRFLFKNQAPALQSFKKQYTQSLIEACLLGLVGVVIACAGVLETGRVYHEWRAGTVTYYLDPGWISNEANHTSLPNTR